MYQCLIHDAETLGATWLLLWCFWRDWGDLCGCERIKLRKCCPYSDVGDINARCCASVIKFLWAVLGQLNQVDTLMAASSHTFSSFFDDGPCASNTLCGCEAPSQFGPRNPRVMPIAIKCDATNSTILELFVLKWCIVFADTVRSFVKKWAFASVQLVFHLYAYSLRMGLGQIRLKLRQVFHSKSVYGISEILQIPNSMSTFEGVYSRLLIEFTTSRARHRFMYPCCFQWDSDRAIRAARTLSHEFLQKGSFSKFSIHVVADGRVFTLSPTISTPALCLGMLHVTCAQSWLP